MKQKFVALICARAGSKGLKNKNIKLFRGKPLIQWTMEAAKKSKYIDYNLISTDSKKIIALSKKMKIAKSHLKQIVKEEFETVLREASMP